MTSDGKTPPDGTGKLRLTMIAAILLSVAGIVYAVRWGTAVDGGRGGAVAVALTFFMLFMGRGTAEDALDAEFPERTPPPPDLLLKRVRNAVASMLDWSRKEKTYLTVSSVTGTLVWGFGDWLARWLGASG